MLILHTLLGVICCTCNDSLTGIIDMKNENPKIWEVQVPYKEMVLSTSCHKYNF